MPAAAVVGAAKAKGIKLSSALVYKVRGRMTGKTKSVPRRGPDPKSASAFVRSQPVSMPVAAVLAAAKAKGIKLSSALVYKVRGKMAGQTTSAPKRGAERQWKAVSVRTDNGGVASRLQVEIERIVERKVDEILSSRLRALLG